MKFNIDGLLKDGTTKRVITNSLDELKTELSAQPIQGIYLNRIGLLSKAEKDSFVNFLNDLFENVEVK